MSGSADGGVALSDKAKGKQPMAEGGITVATTTIVTPSSSGFTIHEQAQTKNKGKGKAIDTVGSPGWVHLGSDTSSTSSGSPFHPRLSNSVDYGDDGYISSPASLTEYERALRAQLERAEVRIAELTSEMANVTASQRTTPVSDSESGSGSGSQTNNTSAGAVNTRRSIAASASAGTSSTPALLAGSVPDVNSRGPRTRVANSPGVIGHLATAPTLGVSGPSTTQSGSFVGVIRQPAMAPAPATSARITPAIQQPSPSYAAYLHDEPKRFGVGRTEYRPALLDDRSIVHHWPHVMQGLANHGLLGNGSGPPAGAASVNGHPVGGTSSASSVPVGRSAPGNGHVAGANSSPSSGPVGGSASGSGHSIGANPSPAPFIGHAFIGSSGMRHPPMPMQLSGHSSLSPTASEFSVGTAPYAPAPWNPPAMAHSRDGSQQSYMVNTEPPNYRRLLDRTMNCNWKYIVDKIVCNNDQQASIFLQQKLKVGTAAQKYEIINAILDQAYPLMINRFGNFLIQRCFEHGSPDQVVAIARAIRGNTLNLSMDAFGCHVVQKAFDCAPEEYKAIMVHELLRRIPETVIHRYACHVWQKLFELRWNGSPPQIMRYVNDALHGMWHEVALGETGSLVVQNIFENCLEEDKRPCVNEVLASIDIIAHGQFGNWCIQHICEHGSIPDRTRAIDHVLRFATEYSMDQFASKVVEKCLKIGGTDFLDRYLDRVCKARPERPRMPLIDIAGDQFGNYLIQHILGSADGHRREVVASHVRRHMVSLRGSKYGSRVALLCTNPAVATRPGPSTSGHTGALDRAPGGSARGYPERGGWSAGRGSYERNF